MESIQISSGILGSVGNFSPGEPVREALSKSLSKSLSEPWVGTHKVRSIVPFPRQESIVSSGSRTVQSVAQGTGVR